VVSLSGSPFGEADGRIVEIRREPFEEDPAGSTWRLKVHQRGNLIDHAVVILAFAGESVQPVPSDGDSLGFQVPQRTHIADSTEIGLERSSLLGRGPFHLPSTNSCHVAAWA
jgi:hypothetical protein